MCKKLRGVIYTVETDSAVNDWNSKKVAFLDLKKQIISNSRLYHGFGGAGVVCKKLCGVDDNAEPTSFL